VVSVRIKAQCRRVIELSVAPRHGCHGAKTVKKALA